MRVSAILSTNYQNRMVRSNKAMKQQVHIEPTKDEVSFQGKGKILGGVLGGAAGAAGGAAIIGGGSLAGAAALAALGPIGAIAVGAYAIGGALLSGYVGSGIGEAIDDKKEKP